MKKCLPIYQNTLVNYNYQIQEFAGPDGQPYSREVTSSQKMTDDFDNLAKKSQEKAIQRGNEARERFQEYIDGLRETAKKVDGAEQSYAAAAAEALGWTTVLAFAQVPLPTDQAPPPPPPICPPSASNLPLICP